MKLYKVGPQFFILEKQLWLKYENLLIKANENLLIKAKSTEIQGEGVSVMGKLWVWN